jgi:hypothetical protein
MLSKSVQMIDKGNYSMVLEKYFGIDRTKLNEIFTISGVQMKSWALEKLNRLEQCKV